MNHKMEVCTSFLVLCFCIPSTQPFIDQGITTVLQESETILSPVMLLDVVEMCFVQCNNEEYNQRALSVLSLLLTRCVRTIELSHLKSSLFSCLLINHRLLPFLQSQRAFNVLISLCLLYSLG